jgi:thiamine transport system permease protein
VVAIRNSLLFALATVCLSLLLGIISAYLLAQPRRWLTALLEPVFLLPLGASAVTLGFGYIVSMGPLRTSPLLIPIAHTLIAAPFVLRTFLPALRSLDPRLRQAAAMLGASPPRVWWEIDAPLLGRAVLVCAAFSFTISLGEFGATLLISRPDLPTMPVVIYSALSRPGLLNLGQALAMSTILMLTCAVGLVAIERFRINEIGEF